MDSQEGGRLKSGLRNSLCTLQSRVQGLLQAVCTLCIDVHVEVRGQLLRSQLLPFDPYISSNSSSRLAPKMHLLSNFTSQRGILILKDQSAF